MSNGRKVCDFCGRELPLDKFDPLNILSGNRLEENYSPEEKLNRDCQDCAERIQEKAEKEFEGCQGIIWKEVNHAWPNIRRPHQITKEDLYAEGLKVFMRCCRGDKGKSKFTTLLTLSLRRRFATVVKKSYHYQEEDERQDEILCDPDTMVSLGPAFSLDGKPIESVEDLDLVGKLTKEAKQFLQLLFSPPDELRAMMVKRAQKGGVGKDRLDLCVIEYLGWNKKKVAQKLGFTNSRSLRQAVMEDIRFCVNLSGS